MSRTRVMSQQLHRERGRRFASREDDYLESKPRDASRQDSRNSPNHNMYLHRPLVEQRVMRATGMLSIVGSMPRDISVIPRVAESLAVSMLGNRNLERHNNHFSDGRNYDPDILRLGINQNVPSFTKPLKGVEVTGVIPVGDARNPVLALELSHPQLKEEIEEINFLIGSLRGTTNPPMSFKPHVSIAAFPGASEIPQNIMDAVDAAVPDQLDLSSGGFYAPNWIR